VADVDKYKEFVPYCTDSKILSRKNNVMEAELVVGFKLLEERYTSIVTLDKPKSIKVLI
jgi:coenzyme Q-binding protein COQ10